VGFFLNAGAWPESLLCIAASVWLTPGSSAPARESRSSGFLIPTIASCAALFILCVGSLTHTGQVAIGLATATLLAAGLRFFLALRRMHQLTAEREREMERAAAAERAFLERAAAAERESAARAAEAAAAERDALERAAAAERESLERAAAAERESLERAAEAAEAQREAQERAAEAAEAQREARERAAAAERAAAERAAAAERESLERAADAAEAEREAAERAAVAEREALARAAAAERESLERAAAAEREFLERAAESERATREALEAAVRSYSEFAGRVADGDLTASVEPQGHEDLQALAGSLNRMVGGLAGISGEIQESVREIGHSTADIVASSSLHSERAERQSEAIHATTITVNALRVAADAMAKRARDVAHDACESIKVSDEGTEALAAIAEAMQEIRARVDGIGREIEKLSERTQQIGVITATVHSLADQSNLLALNAKLEAARAGEHGRGFAVVAEHVRNLSEQSKQATASVEAILNDVKLATRAAVQASQAGGEVVDAGLALTDRAATHIVSLAETIRSASSAAEQIAEDARRQSVGMDEIAGAMGELGHSTVHFLDGAEQSQRAAETLDVLSVKLSSVTERYRVSGERAPLATARVRGFATPPARSVRLSGRATVSPRPAQRG
jgi:methyl-accepting chemotaxis protein